MSFASSYWPKLGSDGCNRLNPRRFYKVCRPVAAYHQVPPLRFANRNADLLTQPLDLRSSNCLGYKIRSACKMTSQFG